MHKNPSALYDVEMLYILYVWSLSRARCSSWEQTRRCRLVGKSDMEGSLASYCSYKSTQGAPLRNHSAKNSLVEGYVQSLSRRKVIVFFKELKKCFVAKWFDGFQLRWSQPCSCFWCVLHLHPLPARMFWAQNLEKFPDVMDYVCLNILFYNCWKKV